VRFNSTFHAAAGRQFFLERDRREKGKLPATRGRATLRLLKGSDQLSCQPKSVSKALDREIEDEVSLEYRPYGNRNFLPDAKYFETRKADSSKINQRLDLLLKEQLQLKARCNFFLTDGLDQARCRAGTAASAVSYPHVMCG
jgi:hypothetical protein